jgi:hypothetical protein
VARIVFALLTRVGQQDDRPANGNEALLARDDKDAALLSAKLLKHATLKSTPASRMACSPSMLT